MSNILVVDDEPAICWGVKQLLEREGHQVTILSSGEAALSAVDASEPDLMLMDVRLPGISGLEALDKLRVHHPNLPIVIMTAFGQLDIAVQVMRHTGVDYLAKPFDLDQVAGVVHRMLQDSRTAAPEDAAGIAGNNQDLLGRTPVMQALFKQIALTSASDLPVLITGESGTVRSWSRIGFTNTAAAPVDRTSQSLPSRSAQHCSKAKCSVTSKAPSPAPWIRAWAYLVE